MDRRDIRLLVSLAALSAVLLLAFSFGAVDGALLYAAPLALLGLPLAAGHYVGESSIERWCSARPVERKRTPVPATLTRRGPARMLPRGGLLVAASLAERGPPRAAIAF